MDNFYDHLCRVARQHDKLVGGRVVLVQVTQAGFDVPLTYCGEISS